MPDHLRHQGTPRSEWDKHCLPVRYFCRTFLPAKSTLHISKIFIVGPNGYPSRAPKDWWQPAHDRLTDEFHDWMLRTTAAVDRHDTNCIFEEQPGTIEDSHRQMGIGYKHRVQVGWGPRS